MSEVKIVKVVNNAEVVNKLLEMKRRNELIANAMVVHSK